MADTQIGIIISARKEGTRVLQNLRQEVALSCRVGILGPPAAPQQIPSL